MEASCASSSWGRGSLARCALESLRELRGAAAGTEASGASSKRGGRDESDEEDESSEEFVAVSADIQGGAPHKAASDAQRPLDDELLAVLRAASARQTAVARHLASPPVEADVSDEADATQPHSSSMLRQHRKNSASLHAFAAVALDRSQGPRRLLATHTHTPPMPA